MKDWFLLLLSVLMLATLCRSSVSQAGSDLSGDQSLSRLVRSPGTGRGRTHRGKVRRSKRRTGKGKKSTKRRRRPTKRKTVKGSTRRKMTKKKSGLGSRMSGRTVSDTCFEASMTVMRMWKDIIANFEKQTKRMTKQNGTGDSKAGKKGVFGPVAQKLVSAGGGDKTNLSCAGTTDTPGANQLKNLTDVLSKCEADVSAACDPALWPQPNMTKVAECEGLVVQFKAAAQECLDKSVGASATDTDTACDCWTSAGLDQIVQAAKMCKFPTEAKDIAVALKNCTSAFGTCRKYEDDAITAIAACSVSANDLVKKAAALSQNIADVAAAQQAVNTLAGSSRVSGEVFSRQPIIQTSTQTPIVYPLSSCNEFLTLVEELITLVSQDPSSPQISYISRLITQPDPQFVCTSNQLDILLMLEPALEKALSHLQSALDSVQDQLQTVTGSTASSAAIASGTTAPTTPAPPTTTGAPTTTGVDTTTVADTTTETSTTAEATTAGTGL